MKIALVGDMHRDMAWLDYVMDHMADENVDAVVFEGDWGYTLDRMWREITSELADEYNIPIYWFDGNHENHAWIAENRTSYDEFNEMWPGVFYIPRGHIWEWEGVRFMAVGGAYSIDHAVRTLGSSEASPMIRWLWQDEQLTVVEYRHITDKEGTVDIMLTHDAPYGVPTIEESALPIRESIPHRMALYNIVVQFQPKLIIHGHWHYGYTDKLDVGPRHTPVVGLAANPRMMKEVDFKAIRFLNVDGGKFTDLGFCAPFPVDSGALLS